MLLDTTNQLDFDIVSALRGPDFSNYCAAYLKSITTEVIRYFVGVDLLVLDKQPTAAKTLWRWLPDEEKTKVISLWVKYFHFRNHIGAAIIALDVRLAPDSEAAKKLAEYKIWLAETLGRV